MYKIIEKDFKMTSIISKGAKQIDELTASLVKQFENKNILLWQDKNLYFPCKRLEMCFGVELVELLNWHIDDFDLLIINKFKDYVNHQDTVEFIEYLSKVIEREEKQVVIFFSAKTKENCNNVELEDFKNLKNVIEKYSDRIYNLKFNNCYGYIIEDLHSNKKLDLVYDSKGINRRLKKVDTL